MSLGTTGCALMCHLLTLSSPETRHSIHSRLLWLDYLMNCTPAATVVELSITMYSQHSLTDFCIEYLQELNYKCKIKRFKKDHKLRHVKLEDCFKTFSMDSLNYF